MLIFQLTEDFTTKGQQKKKKREEKVTWAAFTNQNILWMLTKEMFNTVNVTCEVISQSECSRKIYNNKATCDNKHRFYSGHCVRSSTLFQPQANLTLLGKLLLLFSWRYNIKVSYYISILFSKPSLTNLPMNCIFMNAANTLKTIEITEILKAWVQKLTQKRVKYRRWCLLRNRESSVD